MTREDAKQLLPIIQAFSEGKCIQTKTGSGWVNMENMSFAGKPKAYRIKPESKYRPFENAEASAVWVIDAEKYLAVQILALHYSVTKKLILGTTLIGK